MKERVKRLMERFMYRTRNKEKEAERFKQIVSMPLGESLNFNEYEQFKETVEEVLKANNSLNEELNRISDNMQDKTGELRNQADQLRKEKARISILLSERFANGEDAADLFLSLQEVNTKLRQVDDLVSILERQKKYPGTAKTKEKGKMLFEAGVKMYQAKAKLEKDASKIRDCIADMKLIIGCYEEEMAAVLDQSRRLGRAITQSYAQFNTEYASCKWDELDSIVVKEIDNKLKGV